MDDVWKRDEIESPCIKICVIHPAERLFRVAQPERLRAVMDCNAWRRFMGFG